MSNYYEALQDFIANQMRMSHMHLIPRRDSDTEDPRGGVRGVIAGKQNY